MRIYVSGRMAGLSEETIRERFGNAERYLGEKGCKVFNPARWRWFLRPLPYRFCLAFDLVMMCFCDGIFLLEGWTESDGAVTEHRFACVTGMTIYYEK